MLNQIKNIVSLVILPTDKKFRVFDIPYILPMAESGIFGLKAEGMKSLHKMFSEYYHHFVIARRQDMNEVPPPKYEDMGDVLNSFRTKEMLYQTLKVVIGVGLLITFFGFAIGLYAVPDVMKLGFQRGFGGHNHFSFTMFWTSLGFYASVVATFFWGRFFLETMSQMQKITVEFDTKLLERYIDAILGYTLLKARQNANDDEKDIPDMAMAAVRETLLKG